MFRNYLKVAVPISLSTKGYSVINILGLAVGITCCILIMLICKKMNSAMIGFTANRIVYTEYGNMKNMKGKISSTVVTSLPMAAAIQHNYPEVEATCGCINFNPDVKVASK